MPELPSRPRHWVRATAAAGALLTLLAVAWHDASNRRRIADELDGAAGNLVERITRRMASYEFGLRGARGAVVSAGVERITPADFARYHATRDLGREFPGALGFGFIRRIRQQDSDAYVRRQQAQGRPGFTLHGLGATEAWRYPIELIEPQARHQEALGLDIATEPVRRAGADAAMRDDQARLTAPLTLVQAIGKPRHGFLLLLPVYRDAAAHANADERSAALLGWSYAPLLIDDVLADIDWQAEMLSLRISDHGLPPPAAQAGVGDAAFFATPGSTQPQVDAALSRSFGRPLFGRQWQFDIAAQPGFVQRLALISPLLTALSGLLATLLCTAALRYRFLLRMRDAQARAAVQQLAELANNSSDAVISESLDGRVTAWNAAAERIFGWTAREAMGRPLGELIGTPDTARETADILHRVGRGEAVAPFDSRRRHRDGERVDVSIAVAPLRGRDGAVVGVGKNLRDIRPRLALEARLRELASGLESQVAERTAQLDAARRDLLTILDALPSMVGYWDRNLVNRFANKAYHRWFGVDPGQLPGTRMQALLGPALFEADRVHVDGALGGQPQSFERSLPAPDGSQVVHSLAHYLPDVVDGEVRGFYVLVHDVSELTRSRLQLAALLRENQSLLSTIQTHALFSATDAQGCITEVNDHFCAASGRSRASLLGQDHRSVGSGQHEPAFWSAMWRSITAGRAWRGQICNRHADGRLVWLDSLIAPVLDATGRPERYISIRFDVTERVQAQRRVLDNEAFLETAGRVARVGGWQLDLASRQLTWTRQTHLIHDTDPARPPDLPAVLAQYAPPARAELEAAIEQAIACGMPWDLELPLTTATGRAIWIRTVGEVEHAGSGAQRHAVRLVGAVQDITARRAADEALRRLDSAEAANQAKSVFLANMSHEMRTPLNAVIGFTQALSRSELTPEQRADLRRVQTASRTLLGVINDVLDLSKIEAGHMRFESQAFRWPSLVDELREMIAPTAQAKGLHLQMHSTPHVPPLLVGDALRLRQVLTNLLSNAVKFTERGSVSLHADVLGDDGATVQLGLTVRDTGIGIAPEVQGSLFKPFVQGDSSTTRRFGGTGLGLSIVRLLVEGMGGQVALHSVPGQGTEVSLQLPLARPAPGQVVPDVPESALEPNAQRLPGLRVLVADDNESNREVALRVLAHEGATVTLCDDGAQAMAWLHGHADAVDVVVLDIQMPVMDGLQAAREIRRQPRIQALPVVALTAGTLVSEQQTAMAAGMDEVVHKPFSSASLVHALRRAIERRGGTVPPPVQRPETPAAAVASTGPAAATDAEAILPGDRNAAAWPVLAGIDQAGVRERLQDDAALFVRLLERMLREFEPEFGDAARALAVAPGDLARRLHKLRGSAAMLGAQALHRDATAAESLAQGVAAAAPQGLAGGAAEQEALAPLRQALAQVAADLASLAAQAPCWAAAAPPPLAMAAAAGGGGGGGGGAPAWHAELAALLARHDLAALALARQHGGALAQHLGTDEHRSFERALADLAFDRALQIMGTEGALH